MLDSSLQAQLGEYLKLLKSDIELVANLDDSDASSKTRELLGEIEAASSKVSVREVQDDTQRVPSFLITQSGTDSGVRFAGVPLGHEFTSLVLALLQVSGHPSKEDADLQAQVAGLSGGKLHFETYFSLTCQNCPDVVQALNLMAVLNPNISHTAIEGGAYQSEIDARSILSVPTVYLNGELFSQGRMSLADIVAKLDTGGDADAAEALNQREPYDVLVVGGGPAGATAAMYAARKGIRVGVIAERMGGQINDTATIENYPSVLKIEGTALGSALEQHVRQYGVDVISSQQVVALKVGSPKSKAGGAEASGSTGDAGTAGTAGHAGTAGTAGNAQVSFANGGKLASKTVILATGASWRNLGVPGETEYRNKGVTYCPHCDGPLFKGKPVVVVGGGNSGVEAAIDLAGICTKVTLLEFLPELKADQVLVEKLRSLANVEILLNSAVAEVIGDGSRVTKVAYTDRVTGGAHKVEANGVFVQIGLVPATAWLADSGVTLTSRGEIEIDAAGRTSLPGVFAAGDCTTVPFKQVVVAAGEGAKAALSAFDYLMRN